MVPQPNLFQPHPHLDDEINRNICESEVEGGVLLDDLPVGTHLEVETKYHVYDIENLGSGKVRIAGHPTYCPEPALVSFHGSTWGKSMIKMHYVGRGMRLEFRHPVHGIIHTSKIREVRELPPAPEPADALKRQAC